MCIKWGDKYSAEYVNNLARAVRRHLTLPHRFVCLTDDARGIDRGVETKALTEDLPGWWNKLALFKPRIHDLQGSLLYFDLDMIVVRNIDDIARFPGDFLAVPAARAEHGFAATLLRFEIGRYERVWDRFAGRAADVMQNVYGDQNWINACLGQSEVCEYTAVVRRRWPEVTPRECGIRALPRQWFADVRVDMQGGRAALPAAARVVVFHGQPMIHETEWAIGLWRGDDRADGAVA